MAGPKTKVTSFSNYSRRSTLLHHKIEARFLMLLNYNNRRNRDFQYSIFKQDLIENSKDMSFEERERGERFLNFLLELGFGDE